jgi:two-component system, NarL family, nitrate/nitrite response regulator NarL
MVMPDRRSPTAVALLGQPGVNRDALGRALKLVRDLHVGVATTPSRGTAERAAEAADVVVLDARGLNSHAVFELLAPHIASGRILLIVDLGERDVVLAGAAQGVKSFMPQGRDLSDLVDAIRLIATGRFYCPSEITEILLSQIELAVTTSGVDRTLTHRESEVVDLLAQGLSNKEIARALGIALPTVKNHVHAVLEKLNARNRTEAVVKLREDRSFDPPF